MSKTILITGAGSGFGLGAAIGLAKKGHSVIAGVEIWPQATAVREAAAEAGVEMSIIKLDVTNAVDREHALRHDIDILVNNAGIGATGPIAEIPVDFCREVMEVNVWSALELTQGFVNAFVARRSGKIVFLSSIAGVSTYPFLAPYNASKHVIEAIAQCMKNELKDYGVRVCTINPGPYRTGFNDRMYDQVDQWYSPDRNFTKEGPIREIQQSLGSDDGQFDPQPMIDKMVEVIPNDGEHLFRTMLPTDFEQWCKDYQEQMWEERV